MKRSYESHRSKRGFVLLFFLVGLLVLLIYGMIVLKTEQMYTFRARLNLAVASALNAALNVSPDLTDMGGAACENLKFYFDMSGIDCSALSGGGLTSQSFSELGGSYTCNVSIRSTIESVTDSQVLPSSLCVKIEGCKSSLSFTELIGNVPYLAGAEACAEKKPGLVMILADYSQSMYKIFNGDIPPHPLLHPDAGYGELSSNDTALLEDTALPYVYDAYLDDISGGRNEPSFPVGTVGAPYHIYKMPFSSKEYDSGNGASYPTGDTQLSSLSGIRKGAYMSSMPYVVPQTKGYSAGPELTGELDPIQYIPYMNGGLETETWAEANSYQDYKWRHGVMTQNELAHRCFGPHKYVLQRTVQQFMYMLENLGIPFGAAIFNNWIIPIMPLIPYEDRFGASWPAKYSLNRRSTLDLPVLGPDPVDVNNVDYVSVEFGDPSISFPSDNTDPVKYANYTRFSREAVFDRILQPMTICARDMNIDIRQGEPGAEPLHIFRALPDPYDLSRPLYPSTTCLDATKHQVPTLERGLLNFIFRGAEASAGKTDPQHSSGNSYPTIHSGDCFGDQLDDFKAPYSKDSLYPDPEINKYSSPCYYTATELPEWMTRDRSDAISSNDIGCSSDYDPPNYCFNRDDVNVSEIIAPYRLCPDTKTELENTLSNINAATVLSTIRAGGFSKSGYPLNVPAEATFPIANAKERYLTSPESLYVYPQREDPIEDDFLPGAFMTAYNIISSSGTTIPNPNNYNRVVVVFTDGVSRVSFDDVVGKDFNYTDWGQGGAWFSSIPSSDVLPIFEKVTSDPFPYSETSIKEALQLIHTMVDDGIKVVVVILDRIDKNGWDNALQQFFIDGLKEPIGETDTVGTTYRYALCKKCGAGEIWTNCNLPLSHEPAITANNPQNCINKPPREGIVLIQATKLFSTTPGDPTETYSTFHKRAFSSILPSLNRAINTFTLSK